MNWYEVEKKCITNWYEVELETYNIAEGHDFDWLNSFIFSYRLCYDFEVNNVNINKFNNSKLQFNN